MVNAGSVGKSEEEIVSEEKELLFEVIKKEIIETSGSYSSSLLLSELSHGRKNTTHHFIKLIRIAIKVMKEEEGKQKSIDRFRKQLSYRKANVRMITKLFREPQFASIIEYFKHRIFLRKKLPALIGVLDIRSSEKYIMQELAEGFVYSLHHPEEDYASWNIESHLLVGNTSSIVRQIKDRSIGYEEAMSQVNQIYDKLLEEKPEVGNSSKYNNISYTYVTKLLKVFKELQKSTRSKLRVKQTNLQFEQLNKTYSMEGVRQLLGIEELRVYIKTHYIDNKQLMIDFLEDGGLSCHNKKLMMEAYPKFAAAVEDPNTLSRWH